MAVRGIRGATTTDEDSETAIVDGHDGVAAQIPARTRCNPAISQRVVTTNS